MESILFIYASEISGYSSVSRLLLQHQKNSLEKVLEAVFNKILRDVRVYKFIPACLQVEIQRFVVCKIYLLIFIARAVDGNTM